MDQYAVIDLGTNTFHLLIAEHTDDGQINTIHRERIYVKLAESGIEKIDVAPFQRGLDSMIHFSQIINDRYPSAQVKAFGTAALRTASNASDFISQIKAKSGIHVQAISGDEEAHLIYLGVSQVVDFHDHCDLIMDIGGGSVEFIIANQSGTQWAQSFQIGVAVLFHLFHKSDPISTEETTALNQHLSKILRPLTEALKRLPVKRLIGASGTFDVVERNLVTNKVHLHRSTIDVADFFPLQHRIVQLTLKQRLALEKLPRSRADMVVVALLLIQHIIKATKVEQIIVSGYAMKEGILKELTESK